MLCLARSIPSYRAGFQILSRRPVPTTIHWPTSLVRISHYADIRNPRSSRAEVVERRLTRKAQKKALRTERRAKEKEEAKILGTPAAIKAEIKAQKLAKKLENRAQSKAGEIFNEEANTKVREQWIRGREALKSQTGPTRRQDHREPSSQERLKRSWSGKKGESDALSGMEETPRRYSSKNHRPRTLSDNSQSSPRSDWRKEGKRDGSGELPGHHRRIDNTNANANTLLPKLEGGKSTFDRKSDGPERPRRSFDRGDKTATPSAAKPRPNEPLEKIKREQWMVQKEAIKKKFGDEAWAPKKRLSPDTLEAIRTMHTSDPDKFSTPLLAEQFKVSAEVIRRILRTKWQPDEATVQDRQERWARRGERIWTKQAELGVRPPKKWRDMGVAQTETGVAPKWKKNAHVRDKHFVAQRKGASSGLVDVGYKKPFAERIL